MSDNPQVTTQITQAHPATIYAKMAQVMGKLDRIEKRGRNTQQNYDFVKAEDIADAVRRAMSEVNLAFFVNIGDVHIEPVQGRNSEGRHATTELLFTFADGDTGETITCKWIGEAIDYGDKALAKSVTSGMKYFLMKTFVISSGDDPDSDADSSDRPANPTRRNLPPMRQPPAPAKQGNGNTPPPPDDDMPSLGEAEANLVDRDADPVEWAGSLMTPTTSNRPKSVRLSLLTTDDLKKLKAAVLSVEARRALSEHETDLIDACKILIADREK